MGETRRVGDAPRGGATHRVAPTIWLGGIFGAWHCCAGAMHHGGRRTAVGDAPRGGRCAAVGDASRRPYDMVGWGFWGAASLRPNVASLRPNVATLRPTK